MHGSEGVRHYDQAPARLAGHYRNCVSNFVRVADTGCYRLNRKRACCYLEWFEEKRSPAWRGFGIEYDCRSRDARCNLLEHFEPLSNHRWREISEAGCAATWPRDAR